MSQSIVTRKTPQTENPRDAAERAPVIVAAQTIECQAFTVCYALKQQGVNADLWALPGATDHPSGSHYREQVVKNVRRELSDDDMTAGARYQHAIAILSYRPPSPGVLHKIANLSASLTLLIPSFDERVLRRFKMTLGHLLRFRHVYRKRPRLLAYDDPRRLDSLSLLFRRDVLGVDVHHKFLVDESMREAIYAPDWDPDGPRPSRLNFLGNEQPAERSHILQDVESSLGGMGINVAPDIKSICPWFRINSNSGHLSGQDYLDVLTRSDFTLCPPGYSSWSHRAIEAMTRGSIPILCDRTRPIYGVPLVAGENCIAVVNGRWAEAVERALSLNAADLASMRRRLRAMLVQGECPLSHAAITGKIASRLTEGAPVRVG